MIFSLFEFSVLAIFVIACLIAGRKPINGRIEKQSTPRQGYRPENNSGGISFELNSGLSSRINIPGDEHDRYEHRQESLASQSISSPEDDEIFSGASSPFTSEMGSCFEGLDSFCDSSFDDINSSTGLSMMDSTIDIEGSCFDTDFSHDETFDHSDLFHDDSI